MKKRYVQNANHSYMILEEQQADYQMQMILVNQIEGLLRVSAQQTNGRIDFYYEISSMISLERMCQDSKMKAQQIQLLFLELQHLISMIESYLLDENRLSLVPEEIYFEKTQNSFYFCFAPNQYKNQTFQESLKELIQYIMKCVDHEDEISMKIAYSMFHVVIQEHFRLEDILMAINHVSKQNKSERETLEADDEHKESKIWTSKRKVKIDSSNTDSYKKKSKVNFFEASVSGALVFLLVLFCFWKTGYWKLSQISMVLGVIFLFVGICLIGMFLLKKQKQSGNIQKEEISARSVPIQKTVVSAAETEEQMLSQTIFEPEQATDFIEEELPWRNLEENFEETTILGFSEERKHQFLSREPSCCPSIVLDVYPFIIGKDKEYCNVVLNVNTVSRIHAKIEKSGEQIFITDLGSKNGTWVNQKKIEAKQKENLKAGDEVKIADLVFTFL